MATGQKKGKMITLWLLRVVVGLAFLAAGGHPLCGGNAGCRDGERYWLPSHNPGRKPPPTDCSSSSHKPYRLAEQKHLTVGSAVNLNRTSACRGQDKLCRGRIHGNG